VRIEVRLHGRLPGAQPGSRVIELGEGARLSDAFALLGLSGSPPVVALLDGGPAWPDTPLRDGARLELMPIVDGG